MKKNVQVLVKTGYRYNSSFFRLYLKPSAGYKIGFIAGRKTGKAAERNYVKRSIRELWRKKFKTGDFLFILKPGIGKIGADEILTELEDVIKIL